MKAVLAVGAAVALTTGIPASAIAQSAPKIIETSAGAAWKHTRTGMVFPAALAGLPRLSVREFATDQWDVAGVYELPGQTTALTVYVYQPAVQDASLWFAEARLPVIGRQDRYGKVTEFVAPTPFAPAGESVASGLRATWSADGPYKSTALAVAPLGSDWIVKIRLSAIDKDAPALDALLTQVLGELKIPRAENAPAAVPIAACTTKLKQLKPAKPAQNDGASALLGGLLSAATLDQATKRGKASKPPPPSAPWCRDDALSTQLNVYRRDDASEFYLLSTGDSGRAAIAERDALASLLAGSKGAPPAYSVQFVVPGEAIVFGNYDRLPPPSQVIEIVNANKWKSRTTRTAKGSNITINPDTMK